MDSCSDDHLYPLTSLQIGNIKATLSRAFLYFAPNSHKFLILVDNQSWRNIKHSRSTHIKEFVTTRYRTSPFRNTRPLLRSSSFCMSSSSHETKSLFKWFPILNMASLREKAPFNMKKLHKDLHGLIVFEVSWKDVRGINYLNHLLADGSIALEVKSLTKWEFNGISQALTCISSWFSGTLSETQTLMSNLILLQDKVPSHSTRETIISSNDLLLNEASQADEASTEEEFFDVSDTFEENDRVYMDHHQVEEPDLARKTEQNMEADCDTGPMGYKDILLLCRFNNKDLPFELKQIITHDLKLLPLLESGLPTWVIFLQSYPLLCALYRPWMRPLFKTLCILVSLVTIIIGFYDLYKNVPLLKAAISHLCGPFFNWIESWEMISRIRYLGTMLFLQNFEKAVKVFLMITRAVKLLVLLVKESLMYPVELIADFLMPLWTLYADAARQLCNIGSVMIEFLRSVVDFLGGVLIPPLEFLFSYPSTLATLINPFLSFSWELFLLCTQHSFSLANYLVSLFYDIYEVFQKFFSFAVSNITQLTHFARVKPDLSEFSFWHSLWKDLFSKVFRSLRSIIRVLSAFIASCNRHRLSIYNYLRSIFQQLSNLLGFSSSCCKAPPQSDSHDEVDKKEL